MRLVIILLLSATVYALPSIDVRAEDKSHRLRAGAAITRITPPLGGDIIGGFQPIPATQIHDELHARSLVLDNGENQLAIVVGDLLGLHRAVSDEARRLIAQQTSILPHQVMISATHTHSACSALGEPPLDEYQRSVAQQIARGVEQAQRLLRPAELAFGTAEAPEHVFNRRWYMRPGTMPINPFGRSDDQVKMNPPAGSANLVEPAGPIDPVISFIAVREPNGAPIALFAAYSLHYVGGVGWGDISADYFAIFCEEIVRLQDAQHQEPPLVAMLANGTSGDINNINFRDPGERQQPYVQMRRVAVDLAEKVNAAMKDLSYRTDVRLDASYREPKIAYRHPDMELVEWAKETLAAAPAEGTDLARIYAERTLKMAERPSTADVPLQVLRIGDVAIATMPCEVFCEIGLDYRQRSPIKPAFMVSLAHGYFGYLPTPRQHRLGGYETWLGTNQLEVAASEKLMDHLLEMTADLAP